MATTIPKALYNNYATRLDGLKGLAQKYITANLKAYLKREPTVSEVREFSTQILELCARAYGLQASVLASAMYDVTADLIGDADLDAAETVDPDDEWSASKIAHYQAGKLVDGDTQSFVKSMAEAARDRVATYADQTFIQNSLRPADKKAGMRFARILTGLENCTFCTMLASRGFVYTTYDSAYQLGRRHRNCDCTVISGPAGADIEGYDKDAIYDRWQAFEEIDRETHEDGTPWTRAEKDAAKDAYAKEHPIWT